ATSGPVMPFCHKFGPTKLLSSFSVKKHPIHNFRSKAHVLGGFAPFGCRKCTVAASGPGMPFCHEFGPTKLLSSSFGQKASSPLLSVQNSRVGWFRTIWLPQVHRCNIGSWDALLALVRADETIVELIVKTHAIHYFGSKAYVLAGFAPFGCRKCTVAASGPGMPFCHEFGPTELLSSFFGQKASNPIL